MLRLKEECVVVVFFIQRGEEDAKGGEKKQPYFLSLGLAAGGRAEGFILLLMALNDI